MSHLATGYLDAITDAPSLDAIDIHTCGLVAYLRGYLRPDSCPPDLAAEVAFTVWAAGGRRAARMRELGDGVRGGTVNDGLRRVVAAKMPPPLPRLYSTVADLDGNLGLVRSEPVIWPGITTVQVEWDDCITEASVDDLLTEYGRCSHGGPVGSPNKCGMDTAPGYERCEKHGGASPLDIDVAVRR